MRIASGIRGEDVKIGAGAVAKRGCVVTIKFQCTLNRGEVVRASIEIFQIGKREVIAGLERGVIGMRVGGNQKVAN